MALSPKRALSNGPAGDHTRQPGDAPECQFSNAPVAPPGDQKNPLPRSCLRRIIRKASSTPTVGSTHA